ncbi:MAG: hypothetical protein ACYDBB_27165 [Armatimonadota bacterium]
MTILTSKRLILVLLGALALLAAGTALFGEEPAAPQVEKAVRWASADGAVEIVLTPVLNEKTRTNYRLIVISAKELQVTYHTSRNSTIKVDEALKPIASSLRDVKVYEFDHYFSRTTIWMALTFTRDGKAVDELTRTFRGEIEHTVPNTDFLK